MFGYNYLNHNVNHDNFRVLLNAIIMTGSLIFMVKKFQLLFDRPTLIMSFKRFITNCFACLLKEMLE